MFDKFSTGNFDLREQGMGNGKDWEGLGNTQKTIKSSPLSLQGYSLLTSFLTILKHLCGNGFNA
jgi:hypothetical protein